MNKERTAFYGVCCFVTAAIWISAYGFPLRLGISGEITIIRLLHFLQKWQVLLSAFVAVLVAIIAYRGARLAYEGAMRRIEFDGKVNKLAIQRKALGVARRLELSIELLGHEAGVMLNRATVSPESKKAKLLKISNLNFTEIDATKESWENLENFPESLATDLFNIKTTLYNFSRMKINFAERTFELAPDGEDPAPVKRLKTILRDLQEQCEKAVKRIVRLTAKISAEIEIGLV